MKATLTHELEVEHVTVFAELGFLERRPELGALCRAAQEHGEPLSPEVVGHVLPGLTPRAAGNVVAWCRSLALCDDHGGLTGLGREVARSDEAPVVEQGVFDLWLAQHPLLGSRILHVVRRYPDAHDARFEAPEPLPARPDQGVVFRSVVDPDLRYVLRDLPAPRGEVACRRHPAATCSLRWELDFDADTDRWRLEGQLPAAHPPRPLLHPGESHGYRLSRALEHWDAETIEHGDWDPERALLAVPLERLTDGEQDSFSVGFEADEVEVPGIGRFGHWELDDVPVGPVDAGEAGRWALSRLGRALRSPRRYRGRAEVRQLFSDLVEGSPLDGFSAALPEHDALCALHADDPPTWWALAAPVDLSPEPVEEEP